jgi:hypothetical protein
MSKVATLFKLKFQLKFKLMEVDYSSKLRTLKFGWMVFSRWH